MSNMLQFYKEIRLDAEQMEFGQTLRTICPACKGGTSREKSLSITLFSDMKVKFQCFRESCPRKMRGLFYLTNAEMITARNTPSALEGVKQRDKDPKRKKFDGPTYPLTDKERQFIFKAWGIRTPRFWYHTAQFGGRVAMSVRSPLYKARGWVLRDLEGTARTKALTYIWPEEVALSWYTHAYKPLRGTLLVEDIPSAVRAAPYMDAVALLGTGCGFDRATEIAKYGQLPIIIALDQDATSTAFEMLDRWGLRWNRSKVLPLKHDLKDMDEEGLKALLEGAAA